MKHVLSIKPVRCRLKRGAAGAMDLFIGSFSVESSGSTSPRSMKAPIPPLASSPAVVREGAEGLECVWDSTASSVAVLTSVPECRLCLFGRIPGEAEPRIFGRVVLKLDSLEFPTSSMDVLLQDMDRWGEWGVTAQLLLEISACPADKVALKELSYKSPASQSLEESSSISKQQRQSASPQGKSADESSPRRRPRKPPTSTTKSPGLLRTVLGPPPRPKSKPSDSPAEKPESQESAAKRKAATIPTDEEDPLWPSRPWLPWR